MTFDRALFKARDCACAVTKLSHSYFFCKLKKKRMAQAMRYRQLGSTNMKLSIISLGGSGYGRNYGPYDEQEAIKALE